MRLPELRYVPTALTADSERVVMEYTRRVPGEPDMPIAEVLEVKGAPTWAPVADLDARPADETAGGAVRTGTNAPLRARSPACALLTVRHSAIHPRRTPWNT